jgi:hypothetical protein
MNRGRYDGYVAARQAARVEAPDEPAAQVIEDLAEGLLLARDQLEADVARERVPQALSSLVDRGELPRRAADRLWARLKACGPPMNWPPSWDRSPASSRGRAVRGH